MSKPVHLSTRPRTFPQQFSLTLQDSAKTVKLLLRHHGSHIVVATHSGRLAVSSWNMTSTLLSSSHNKIEQATPGFFSAQTRTRRSARGLLKLTKMSSPQECAVLSRLGSQLSSKRCEATELNRIEVSTTAQPQTRFAAHPTVKLLHHAVISASSQCPGRKWHDAKAFNRTIALQGCLLFS